MARLADELVKVSAKSTTGRVTKQEADDIQELESFTTGYLSDAAVASALLHQPSSKRTDPHPPGFRALSMDKFSERPGDNDFEVWVEDFQETTTDCGDDRQTVQWFFWFLTGLAKATWQRTIKKE